MNPDIKLTAIFSQMGEAEIAAGNHLQ